MKFFQYISITFIISLSACTKLDKEVYSVVSNDNFWSTADQINSGIAPAYTSLQNIVNSDGGSDNGCAINIMEMSSDEEVCPTRGGDWYDGGIWQQFWLHSWNADSHTVSMAWNSIFGGIGTVNFIIDQINNIKSIPSNVDTSAINAEMKTLRAYYYYLAMDLFGNVPIVKDYKTNPDSITNSKREEVFQFIETDIKNNIDKLPTTVDNSTYGKVNKNFAFALLSKLYLNAKTYTGNPRWQECVDYSDSIILSNDYQLENNYFDNFSYDNENSKENIFTIPFDENYIEGNYYVFNRLHYQSQTTFQLAASPGNGYCVPPAFFQLFDTSCVYSTSNGNIYKAFNDQRTGQFVFGQQYTSSYSYPQYKNILYGTSDASLILYDAGTGLKLNYYPIFKELSNSADSFRLAGARSIKYFPDPGAPGTQSNDIVIFRYADILLTKAEALLRLGSQLGDALNLVNMIRTRAYGDNLHNWTSENLTLQNILNERGRELANEGVRRQDLVRFGKYGEARLPGKPADADDHLSILPIPSVQLSANPHLTQNPGY